MIRNKNVDLIRGISILLIIIYHVYAISGQHGYAPHIWIPILNDIVMFGGEIGVTLFFIMSGYGIYCSLNKQYIENGKIDFSTYMKKRIIRVAPHYYICLVFVLFVTNGASFISRSGIKSIITHLLFLHNLFPETHGSLNGALWTMGTIVQFYVIAVLLYHLVRKHTKTILFGSILCVIVSKYVLFHFLGTELYFIYGRQLITALDNFVIGMVIAKFSECFEKDKSTMLKWIIFILLSVLCYAYIYLSKSLPVYSDTYIGYTWHSMLALLLGIWIYVFSLINISVEKIIPKIILKISKYEYGIYIWHLLIICALFENSSIINRIASVSLMLVTIIIMFCTCLFGIVASKIIDKKVS